ncbi:MAG: hypothetical protein GY851_09470 [bacterium]|nr:hypothetical protein [bacterium]
MKLDIKSKGMDKVAAQMALLANLGATVKGIALHGATRKGGMDSGDVIGFLAEGGRDISPTEDDSDEAAQAYLLKVEERLRMMKSKGWVTSRKGQVAIVKGAELEGKRAAGGAQSIALREAGKVMTKILRDRVTQQTTNDGNKADAVSPAYATWREYKYQVPKSTVFRATGQLLAELNVSGLRQFR